MTSSEGLPRLYTLFIHVEKCVEEEKLDKSVWTHIMPVMLQRCLDCPTADRLRETLEAAYDSSPPKLPSNPPLNDPLLIRYVISD